MRPAAMATFSGENPDSPRAIVSALTNSWTPKASWTIAGAVVDFPAPLGPATTTTRGAAPINQGYGQGSSIALSERRGARSSFIAYPATRCVGRIKDGR